MSRLGSATVDLPKVIQFAEHLFLFNVTTGVAAERGLAHAAGQTAHMPAQVVHLHGTQLAEVNQIATRQEGVWVISAWQLDVNRASFKYNKTPLYRLICTLIHYYYNTHKVKAKL